MNGLVRHQPDLNSNDGRPDRHQSVINKERRAIIWAKIRTGHSSYFTNEIKERPLVGWEEHAISGDH